MRVLFLHVDYLEYEVKEKALKGVPDVPQSKRHGRIEEALVCFISAEKRDEANPAGIARAAAEIVAEATAEGKEELSTALKAEAKLVSHWHILEPNGAVHHLSIQDGKVSGFHFEGHDRLRRFATYEMAKSREAKEEPPHVRLMRELELVDYDPGSDPGN